MDLFAGKLLTDKATPGQKILMNPIQQSSFLLHQRSIDFLMQKLQLHEW